MISILIEVGILEDSKKSGQRKWPREVLDCCGCKLQSAGFGPKNKSANGVNLEGVTRLKSENSQL